MLSSQLQNVNHVVTPTASPMIYWALASRIVKFTKWLSCQKENHPPTVIIGRPHAILSNSVFALLSFGHQLAWVLFNICSHCTSATQTDFLNVIPARIACFCNFRGVCSMSCLSGQEGRAFIFLGESVLVYRNNPIVIFGPHHLGK